MTRPHWRAISWPDHAPITVSVNLDFEAFTRNSQFSTLGRPGEVDRFSMSYGEYGARVGVWRLLDLLRDEGVRASCAINGLAAQRYPDAVRAMVADGHELVAHGWANDTYAGEDPELSEAEVIRRTLDAITTASGGVRPVGWVSPALVTTEKTKELLVQEGLIYTGDDASDDVPFIEEIAGAQFVTVPNTSFSSHDLRQWLRNGSAPTVLRDNFIASFDELYKEGRNGRPGSIALTLHAHAAGRPALIGAVREALRHAKLRDDVWWSRMDEQAEWALLQKMARP
jgi:peptidoglycan/xylan/chitin deacetylase (PgdA/CDA1 family)